MTQQNTPSTSTPGIKADVPSNLSGGSGGGTSKGVVRYSIIPLPKIVFFYPLMLVSLVSGIWELRSTDSTFAGTIFIITFFINTLIISFDFPGVKAIALAFFLIALGLGILWLDSIYEILGPLKEISKIIFQKVHASPMLYFMVSGTLFSMIFGGCTVNYLWNRWIVEPGRLIHKKGLLADVTEYPVIDLEIQKRVDDVFEYILLGSGSLTFKPTPHMMVTLENVMFINNAENKIRSIIRSKAIVV